MDATVASPARPLSVVSADRGTPCTPYMLRELEEGEVVEAITPLTSNIVEELFEATPPASSSLTAVPEVSDRMVDTYGSYDEEDVL